tara:strand:- start:2836 stop:3978 length:1143 start_codon:yes stop_codon:yes gene_type:complete
MKILFLTGSRGEWGYIAPILKECRRKKIKFFLCANNMHLLDSYGLSLKEIQNDGFKIDESFYSALDGYNVYTSSKSLGILIQSLSDMVQRLKPDWIVLAGDRSETMAAAMVSAYSNIPFAHIQSGELSGQIDGQARHAIGKFAHLHFASNRDAERRLIKLGEQKFRIKLVGAPQLDQIYENKKKFENLKYVFKKHRLEEFNKYVLVVYHPPQERIESVKRHFESIFDFLNTTKLRRIWISPNNDSGSTIVKSEFLKRRTQSDYIFDNLSRFDYLTLLNKAEFLLGNSSSGILESPTFKTPCINIGFRQNGRIRSKNIIDVSLPTKKNLSRAYKKIQSQSFKQSIKKIENPYGNGNSSKKIVDILLRTKINDELLFKKLTY